MFPLTSARIIRPEIAFFLFGAMTYIVPNATPSAPRLPKPQQAYVAMTAERF